MKSILPLVCLFAILSLTSAGQSKYLWGTASFGGAHNAGTIVRGDDDGTNFHTVYSFVDSIGSLPVGKMAKAPNGKLYIITELGGDSGSCTICSFDPNTGSVAKVYDFGAMPRYGEVPLSGLMMASNGKLYGIASSGGLNTYYGVIYSFDPATNIYTDVYDFDTILGYAPNAEFVQANDGRLYTVTGKVGTSVGAGRLLSFDPSDDSVHLLHTFGYGYGSNWFTFSGNSPALMQASDNKIYGLVDNLSTDSAVFFNYDIPTGVYSLLRIFSTRGLGIPQSGLIQAGNGKLYGTTAGLNTGMIYSYDIGADSFVSVLSLDAHTGYNPNANIGKLANGNIVFSTTDGGIYQHGALVSFDVQAGTYTVMFSFDSVNTGSSPLCEILETSETTDGIRSNPFSAFSPYPNPASTVLYLSSLENTSYTITNIVGEELIKGVNTSNHEINISCLSSGMYFINGVKFVKE